MTFVDHSSAVSAQRSLNECLIGDQYLVADFIYDDFIVASNDVDVFNSDSVTSWTGGLYQYGWSLGDEQTVPGSDQPQ